MISPIHDGAPTIIIRRVIGPRLWRLIPQTLSPSPHLNLIHIHISVHFSLISSYTYSSVHLPLIYCGTSWMNPQIQCLITKKKKKKSDRKEKVRLSLGLVHILAIHCSFRQESGRIKWWHVEAKSVLEKILLAARCMRNRAKRRGFIEAFILPRLTCDPDIPDTHRIS